MFSLQRPKCHAYTLMRENNTWVERRDWRMSRERALRWDSDSSSRTGAWYLGRVDGEWCIVTDFMVYIILIIITPLTAIGMYLRITDSHWNSCKLFSPVSVYTSLLLSSSWCVGGAFTSCHQQKGRWGSLGPSRSAAEWEEHEQYGSLAPALAPLLPSLQGSGERNIHIYKMSVVSGITHRL